MLVTKNAADQLKHVHLELGGKNAIIVMDDADIDLAVDGIIWSAFGTAGQRCTAASRVIVQRGAYEALKSKLVRAEKLRIGAPWEDDTDIGPVINETAVEKIHSITEIGKGEGATLLTGGEHVEGHGFYYRPTVFADVDPQMRIAQEEIFGPTTALIPVDSFEEAVRAVNSVEYGLSSSIFTSDVNKAFKAMRDIQTGITYINAGTTGAEVHLPFGGMKQTGNGHREAGQAALDVFTEWKSIYVDYSGKLQRAQIDNIDDPAQCRLFTDGGARGNPGPAAYGYVLEGTTGPSSPRRARTSGWRRTTSPSTAPSSPACVTRSSSRARDRSRLRLGAAREADARRVPRQERGAARSLGRGGPACARARMASSIAT